MRILLILVALSAMAAAETVTFGKDGFRFDIEFVTIGDIGIPDDPLPVAAFDNGDLETPMGGVDYVYRIAKFESSWATVMAAAVPYPIFGEKSNSVSYIGEPRPARLNWADSARYINWLNSSSGYPPAYKLNGVNLEFWQPGDSGYDPDNPARNYLARFVLPTHDEYHKAAYYDPVVGDYRLYSTGSTPPTNLGPEGGIAASTALFNDLFGTIEYTVDVMRAGGLSAYGTMGQTGNEGEWEESPLNIESTFSPLRAIRRGVEDGIIDESVTSDRLAKRQINAIFDRTWSRSGLGGVRVIALSQPDPLVGDADIDGDVDFDDFLVLSKNFDRRGIWTEGDFDNDGRITFDDFLGLSANFGDGDQAVTAPEPSSTLLRLLAVFTLVLNQRRNGHARLRLISGND